MHHNRCNSRDMTKADVCVNFWREGDRTCEAEHLACLSRATTLKQEIKFTSQLLIAVIQGRPLALDVKRTLFRISTLVDDLIVLKQCNNEQENTILRADDLHRALARAREAIEQALSLSILVTRPKIRGQCKKLMERLSQVLADRIPLDSDTLNTAQRDAG